MVRYDNIWKYLVNHVVIDLMNTNLFHSCIAKYYQLLLHSTEYYRVLLSVTEYNNVLQDITTLWYSLIISVNSNRCLTTLIYFV